MRDVRCLIALLLVSGSLANWLPGQSARIENLGWAHVGFPFASANAVSADGKVATGTSVVPPGQETLVRWRDGSVENLGNSLGGPSIQSSDLSSNGSVIVGRAAIDDLLYYRAFRWTSAGFVDLGSLAGTDPSDESQASGCSADGQIVVGATDVDATFQHAFRWQNGAMADLGTIESAVGNSVANGCSADGSVIVGFSWNGTRLRACRFSTPGAAIDLGAIDGADENSFANAVSPDGTFIVGLSFLPGGEVRTHAFDLSDAYGFYDLGTVDGVDGNSSARAVSTNGLVTVGDSANDGRTGGRAAVWFQANPRQLWDLLVTDYGLDLQGWTSLDVINDVSSDGNTFVGTGTGFGSTGVPFRVTITPNSPPIVDILGAPSIVECKGGTTSVELPFFVADTDPGDLLTVDFFVDDVLTDTLSEVASPAGGAFFHSYGDGEHVVAIAVTDGSGATFQDWTTVTVADTTSPIVIVSSDVVRPVDKGEVFATISLTPPDVTDICDPTPTVTSNAPAKFKIGTTNVLWTVRDDDGNVAKATQKVTVTNAPPKANAGVDVVKKTTKTSAVATLNGLKSTDPDKHTLKYSWTAVPGVKFSGKTSPKPTGTFKVGTTKVTLTVVDEAGLRSTDTMNVKVQKVRKARKQAANADSAVRESYAAGAKANGKGKASPASAVGLAFTVQAYGLGALAGDNLGAKRSPAADDVGTYVTLRRQQAAASQRAARSFWDAYFLRGHDDALEASLYAHAAGAYAFGDTAGSEYSEVLSVRVE